MRIGYARVSKADGSPSRDLQCDGLRAVERPRASFCAHPNSRLCGQI